MSIDTTSPTWRSIGVHLAERRACLVSECIAVGTSAERRCELAARIAEVDLLLDLPDAMVRTAQMVMPGTNQGSY